MRNFRRSLRQTLLLPVALLLLLAVGVLLQMRLMSRALLTLDAADQISSEITDLQKLLTDQETGLRGFQLTNDPVMLAPYNAGMASIAAHFDHLRTTLQGHPYQSQRLATLHDHYLVWLDWSRRVIARDPALVSDPQLNQNGKQMMDGIRAITDEMLARETARRQRLSAASLTLQRRELLAILLVALAVGLLLGIFTRSRLRRVSHTYQTALDKLEARRQEIFVSRQWFQTTLESIGDAVIACDIDGRITFMNATAQELTGWPIEDAKDLPLQEVFHIVNEETRQVSENPVDQVRRMNTVIGLANHTALIARHGKQSIIDDSAAPVRNAQGEMTGIVLVFRDVTDQKRTESALLAGEKLAVAGRLAASIAHEIHNPLDAVTNLLFLLDSEDDREKRREYLQMAQQELARTIQITRTILSLYREPQSPVPLDLKELVESVLLLLDRRLAQTGSQVERAFSDEPLIVEGFPAELRQVVTNIVVNAVEAAGRGGRIRIRIEPTAAEELRGSGILVEVSDSGTGVPGDVNRSLFQPFFTTKGEGGTGLGLWVSMGIVQKHGGAIHIVNHVDQQYSGASVRIYLPKKTLASAATRSTAHVA